MEISKSRVHSNKKISTKHHPLSHEAFLDSSKFVLSISILIHLSQDLFWKYALNNAFEEDLSNYLFLHMFQVYFDSQIYERQRV